MSNEKQRKPLGKLLKEKGTITEDHIKFAIQDQKITKEKIGEILVRLCFITEYDVATTLSEQEGIPYLDVEEVLPEEEVLKLFNKTLCLNHAFLPIAVEDGFLKVASAFASGPNLDWPICSPYLRHPTKYRLPSFACQTTSGRILDLTKCWHSRVLESGFHLSNADDVKDAA